MAEPTVDPINSGDVHGDTSTAEAPHCTKCAKDAEQQEMAFAFLLALMPVITLTLFGQMGLL